MKRLTLEETTSILHSNGIKCNVNEVNKWIIRGKIKAGEQGITKEQVEDFLHRYQWEGTAYEPGIDDQTRIARLLEEVQDLRLENKRLKHENEQLKSDSEALPF
jgi:predicted RNase H-like nuclease (RuvC/YqgF family)